MLSVMLISTPWLGILQFSEICIANYSTQYDYQFYQNKDK